MDENTKINEELKPNNQKENTKNKSKLRMIIVIAFLALFTMVTYVVLKGSYLEYKELGEQYINVFWTNLNYKYGLEISSYNREFRTTGKSGNSLLIDLSNTYFVNLRELNLQACNISNLKPLTSDVFKNLIFHLCSSIDLSSSFSHIVPVQQPFLPVFVIIFLLSPVSVYCLSSFIFFGHSLIE